MRVRMRMGASPQDLVPGGREGKEAGSSLPRPHVEGGGPPAQGGNPGAGVDPLLNYRFPGKDGGKSHWTELLFFVIFYNNLARCPSCGGGPHGRTDAFHP